MIRIVLSSLLVLFVCGLTAATALSSAYRRASRQVCHLIDLHYFRRSQSDVAEFLANCRARAESQSFLFSKRANIERVNGWLSELRVSHLNLYRPEENRALWEHRSLDTGLRTRRVEADLVVFRVLEESPGARAGIAVGDVIESIDGLRPASSVEAQTLAGEYTIASRGKVRKVRLIPSEVFEDMSPVLTDLGRRQAVLRLPSFLPELFIDEKWLPIVRALPNFDHVIVDLRENAGGSFPAMLRALSPFRCRDRWIGTLVGARESGDAEMRDRLDAQSQLEQLASARTLRLQTFPRYGCFPGAVTVLIDDGTSSTAEIFAESFFTRRKSRVWGQPSAGQVVMAQWFDVPEFGDETALAVPIAGYISATGQAIESAGLRPEALLYYDHDLAVQGRDSWLIESQRLGLRQ